MPPPFRAPRFFQSPLLQPPLNRLFIPRPLPDILSPTDLHLDGYKGPRVTPVAPYIGELDKTPVAEYIPTVTPEEGKRLKKEAAIKKAQDLVEAGLETWKPQENPNATSDALKTLFIGRLAYDLTERQLKREFEVYGEIAEIKMVNDSVTGKFKGYAFIQYTNEEDMKAAYKDADAKRINGRRVVVDVERGRTVKAWKPRRLGGGSGRTRAGGPGVNQTSSGRDSRAVEAVEKERGIQAAGSGAGRRRSDDRERSLSPMARRPDDRTSSYRHRR